MNHPFFNIHTSVGVLLLLSGCAFMPPAEKAVPAGTEPAAEKPAAIKSAALKPEKAVSPPGDEKALLRSVPERVSIFLETLKALVLSHEFKQVEERAEPSHRERFVQKRGMDTESYLSRLFRIGAAYARGESALLPEPGGFNLKTVKAMRYTGVRRTTTSWVVTGILTDSRGAAIDFTLEVLGELETIFLAGD